MRFDVRTTRCLISLRALLVKAAVRPINIVKKTYKNELKEEEEELTS